METLSDYSPLSEAEKRFIDGAGDSARLTFGDGDIPDQIAPGTRIRAALIRFVLLGKDPKIILHDKGIRLRGAVITGRLDLQGCDCRRDISLTRCRIEEPLSLVNASLRGLHISGCLMKGLMADNASFSGALYLRSGTVIDGEISLAGARIGGDLQICDAEIHSGVSDAVFAPSLRVQGSVFLGNYPYSQRVTTLISEGMLFFASARVAHDFFVTNTAISLPAEAQPAAFFGATEEHGNNIALSLGRAVIGGILYMQANQIGRGIVNLAGAEVARLTDEPAGPGAVYPIRLDGFRYGDFSRHAETSLAARLEWLARRPAETPFTAQPYEQLAYVLRRLGHRDDAQTVLMRKEQVLRHENRLLQKNPLLRAVSWSVDAGLRLTVGYGYRPGRAVFLALVLVVALGAFFQRAWEAGDMTPNAAPILISGPWIEATVQRSENPAEFWSQPGQAGQDWETFNAWAYAADLFIPIVSLGQEAAWAPSTSRSPLGRTGWWLRWFAKTVGWIVTALAAAAITGIIRRD
ncbi:hypothetical protein [Candidatus Halocynthiibacter alkanivorans]|uniref:hypothetical protein n=1 Tax=Candidatus Halocynthiibacter alkanivorans TaxID=2267619 RepID=UPI000DF2BC6B|nr:hypothetical protein [Candidatus Halocynthiibacter alkanivorans]